MVRQVTYPVDRERIERLEIESMEADLLDDLADLADHEDEAPQAAPRRRPRPRRLGLGLAGAALAALVVAIVLLTGGGHPTPAYGAKLIRFAERTPLLLLEGPGWGIRNVDQPGNGEGRIEFTKKFAHPHPDEPLETRAEVKRHVTPPAVVARRQRQVEMVWTEASRYKLLWHDGKLRVSSYDEQLHKMMRLDEPGHFFKTTIPALGATAYVDPRAESAWIQGGPGDRAMVAFWEEDGHVIRLHASVPDLAAFRERLDWLRRVGAEEWLDAMPARVVRAADYGATVEAMLEGIPLPPGFDPTKVESTNLTEDHYQVGAAVGEAVACGWFQTWAGAVRAGDKATVEEAERVLRGAGSWPVFREMAKEGAYPATVAEYAKAMPSRHWYGRSLLPAVEEGLGCGSRG